MWKAEISKVVALFVSVKDRWVSIHEQILNVLIACCLMTALVFEGGALLLGDVIIEGLLQAILTVGALLP
jgi:hypothetical protein